ncbi:unnamed protein product [Leptosia nina]|uniref:Uncharacterized protein n=1 Tax=Leptosia nina TaxID=320188 RepID=A0AAV1JYS8_9NEOP
MEELRATKQKTIQNAHHIALDCIHPQCGLFIYVCILGTHSQHMDLLIMYTPIPLLSVSNMHSKLNRAPRCFIQKGLSHILTARLLEHQMIVQSLAEHYVLHPVEAPFQVGFPT